MTDPLDHIRRLAHEIGARPSAGEGERRAAAYIRAELEKFGYLVKTEPFRSPRSFGHVYIPIYLLALGGFVIGVVMDRAALGLLLSGIALVTFLGENTTALKLASAVVPKWRSQNVVARLAPRELPRRRLVLAAHYDTTKAGLLWHPRLVKRFRLSFLVLTWSMAAVPAVMAVSAAAGIKVLLFAAVPFALVVAYGLVVLVHRELFFKHVAGANDNASGVGVVLSLAEALAIDPPPDTEVVVLATGAEEAGMVGMQAFLKKHADEMERAWLINVDNVGAGDVFYTTEEGMLLKHKTGKELRHLAEKIETLPGMEISGRPFRTMSNDTEPVLLRRIEAITVMAATDGVPVNWHWPTDTAENIDPDSVDTAYRFVEAMVRRLIA
ncbi:MAG: hypothetical protein QOE92_2463 [Chloroflexota bacterium]|jgi:hypothetical protein|nr:hypothetical protein [Chloroflexota bacterium]